MAVGVGTIVVPGSALPHGFGYYAVIGAFLLGLRFGFRAIGMLVACCVAIAAAEVAGPGACGASSRAVTCAFHAAAPLLIFGEMVGPVIAGALLRGLARLSRADAVTSGDAPLSIGGTAAIGAAAGVTAFAVFAIVPLHGAPLFMPSIAACVAIGLAPTFVARPAPVAASSADTPRW